MSEEESCPSPIKQYEQLPSEEEKLVKRSSTTPYDSGNSESSRSYESDTFEKPIIKRKAPEGGFLSKEILEKSNKDLGTNETEWKEWSILVLYGLCQENIISVEEKKKYAKLVLEGKAQAYQFIRDYVQSGELNQLKQRLDSL